MKDKEKIMKKKENELPKEEGRKVIEIIMDIQKQNRDEKTK